MSQNDNHPAELLEIELPPESECLPVGARRNAADTARPWAPAGVRYSRPRREDRCRRGRRVRRR